MAAPSETRSVDALPSPERTPFERNVPGSTTSRFVPRLSSCALSAARAPSPTASMAMSAATPMKMPSMVSAERSLLRPMPRPAASIAMVAKDQSSESSDAGPSDCASCGATAGPRT